jgi:hypothetical protein
MSIELPTKTGSTGHLLLAESAHCQNSMHQLIDAAELGTILGIEEKG